MHNKMLMNHFYICDQSKTKLNSNSNICYAIKHLRSISGYSKLWSSSSRNRTSAAVSTVLVNFPL
jgi:hypothetical protein